MRPTISHTVKPMRAMRAETSSPSRCTSTSPSFLGSPLTSRPPMSDCSVVIGMKIGYSPRRSWCRACTPIHPAPNTGSPGISTRVIVMRTRGRSPGSSGGGRMAAMISGSVS